MKKKYTQNREISWLKFNERVLEEAFDDSVLPLEKLKFISIFTDNLTEFFMIRIGSLTDLSILKKDFRENKTGMTAEEQINKVLTILPKTYKKRANSYYLVIEQLKQHNVIQKSINDLTSYEFSKVKKIFFANLYPLISAQIIDSSHPFPFLENEQLYIFIQLLEKKKMIFGLVPIRWDFPKFIILQQDTVFSYILTEDILLHFIDEVFIDKEITSKTIIRVTRNFDFTEKSEIRDEFENYKEYMKAIIKRRRLQQPVRLESRYRIKKTIKKFLLSHLKLSWDSFFVCKSPIKLDYVYELESNLSSSIKLKLCNKSFIPHYPIKPIHSLLSYIQKNDCLLFYPYDDIKFFLDIIKESINNKNVLSIKITIYRLAKNSKLVQYLAHASENGIAVTVFMELKARFDEERNINYSEMLYNAGCTIIFGLEQYKIHSKICLISYREKKDIKFITHIGTGNYNEQTAKIYSDISLITSHYEIGLDANDFFKNISIGNLSAHYTYLLSSPFTLKQSILNFMEQERLKGKDGNVFFKVNSITDKDIIDKLVECSQAGVRVRLLVRGICCILPNIAEYTENIEIKSIIGRFLEHARVYIFGNDSNAQYFISSADLMTRNMEHRVEVAIPILDKHLKEKLKHFIEAQWKDTKKGRSMKKDGSFQKYILKETEYFSSQDYFLSKCNTSEQDKKIEIPKIIRKLFSKYIKY